MADDTTAPEAPAKAAKPKAKTTIEKVKATATELANEAGTAARNAAAEGKTKATEALDTLSKVVDNAANMVEENVGPTYADYARKAATGVSDLSKSLQGKDIDALLDDTRDFVRRQPLVAVGAAAAVGFLLTRLAKIGSNAADNDV